MDLINFYKCYKCGHKWQDIWSCACDDTCPECGARDCSPARSEDVGYEIPQKDFGIHYMLQHWGVFSPIKDRDGDWQYYTGALPSASALTQEQADAIANAINALPALLEALKDLTALYAANPKHDPVFVEKGFAAIAKAIPEQP